MTNTPASVTVAGNILKVATLNVSSEEAAIVELHRGMLGDPDWLIPISIAQKTYRAVYYGMTATALLEDVHFDSLANWLKRHRPQIPFVKPERGQLGDYNILGIDVSHKSMSGPTDTGVNWNALKAANNAAVNPNQVWVSQTPINVISSENSGVLLTWVGKNGVSHKVRALFPAPKSRPKKMNIGLIRWQVDDNAQLLHIWDEIPSFEEIWAVVGKEFASGASAYEYEILFVSDQVAIGDEGVLTSVARPGQYLFPLNLLQNIPLGANNRAALIKKHTILELMIASKALGLWTPLPMWPILIAGERPPDLYLGLRAEFDQLFSPVGR